jgi:hypothetical protein
LLAGALIAAENRDGERPQHLGHLVAHDTQGLGGLRGDQDRLALRQQMADQVADGMRLAGPGRPLDEHRAAMFQPADDLHLLVVGFLGEQDVVVVEVLAGFSFVRPSVRRFRSRRFPFGHRAGDLRQRGGKRLTPRSMSSMIASTALAMPAMRFRSSSTGSR